jgi:hypothetical protein
MLPAGATLVSEPDGVIAGIAVVAEEEDEEPDEAAAAGEPELIRGEGEEGEAKSESDAG